MSEDLILGIIIGMSLTVAIRAIVGAAVHHATKRAAKSDELRQFMGDKM